MPLGGRIHVGPGWPSMSGPVCMDLLGGGKGYDFGGRVHVGPLGSQE